MSEPKVRLRDRLAVGPSADRNAIPGERHRLREEPKLSDRSGTLSFDAAARQYRLVDRSQETSPSRFAEEFLPRSLPGSEPDLRAMFPCRPGRHPQRRGSLDLLLCRAGKARLHGAAVGWVDRGDLAAAPRVLTPPMRRSPESVIIDPFKTKSRYFPPLIWEAST